MTVLFFGATADAVGAREAQIEIPDSATAEVALDQIFSDYPGLASGYKRESLHFSINQEYSTGSEVIREGDELAVFTAVSGG